jgi:hypothetical protein
MKLENARHITSKNKSLRTQNLTQQIRKTTSFFELSCMEEGEVANWVTENMKPNELIE